MTLTFTKDDDGIYRRTHAEQFKQSKPPVLFRFSERLCALCFNVGSHFIDGFRAATARQNLVVQMGQSVTFMVERRLEQT